MAAPARKGPHQKGTARAGLRTARSDPKASRLAEAQAAYKKALQQQAATADILRAIARSHSDPKPVFDAIAKTAVRLLGGFSGAVTRRIGDALHLAAYTSVSKTSNQAFERAFPVSLSSGMVVARAARAGVPVSVADTETDPHYAGTARRMARARGFRSSVAVPMIRDKQVVGTISVTRASAGQFPKDQIQLLNTFAKQAVIAIENARLFNETKDALERQTATAEVLKVISGSPTDVAPVFDAILRSAVNLCGAEIAAVFPFDGKLVHLGATYNWSQEAKDYFAKVYPSPPSDKLMSGRTILSRSIVTLPDAATDPHYDPTSAITGHWRRMLGVPMLREGEPVGAMVVCWREPGDTPQRQVDLLQTFADQAVIAIENVRLFNETKEALERQTATAEILKVISESPTNVQPVFDAVAERAARICGATQGGVLLASGNELRRVAYHGPKTREVHVPIRRTLVNGRAFLEQKTIHVPDVLEVLDEYPDARENQKRQGFRSLLAVPMMCKGDPIGTINVWRTQARPFSAQEIGLLETFADQAVIAIENARLFNETKEALERQTATAEILKVISSSPTDVQPVMDIVARRAGLMTNSLFAAVVLVDGDALHAKATYVSASLPSGKREGQMANAALPLRPTLVTGRAILERRTVHIDDIVPLLDSEYPDARDSQRDSGFRAVLAVPMIRDGQAIGALCVYHGAPRKFSDQEVTLLETFASQAVIAIENVRLFNETKEALERQTATGEILASISGSMTDAKPVFQTIVQNLRRLLASEYALVALVRDDRLQLAAYDGNAGFDKIAAVFPRPIDDQLMTSRAVKEGRVVQIAPIRGNPEAGAEIRRLAETFGYDAAIAAPLVRDGKVIGVITAARPHGTPFDEKQIGLIKLFADQAVIAIENARLFNETKEALEQQTAISEVLRVISGSPSDVAPVLEAVASRAAKICEANDARIFLVEGGEMRHAAGFGEIPVRTSTPLDRDTASGRAVLDGNVVHIEDMTGPAGADFPLGREIAARAGWRTNLAVPLMRERRALGVVILRRREVRPFTDRQIAVLKTFADQAAIAIENVRLFNETKEALERQTATAEVLKTISRSTFDLDTVLQALLDNAARLGGARQALMLRPDSDGNYLPTLSFNWSPQIMATLQKRPLRAGRDSTTGRVLLEKRPLHIPDVSKDPEYKRSDLVELGGYRSVLAVPMLRDGEAIGLITMTGVEPFSEKQTELVTTFADQAVIAIENVRLFNETKEALKRQTATAEILRVISSSPTNIQPVLDAVAERAARLCDATDAIIRLVEGDNSRVVAHFGPDPATLGVYKIRRGGLGSEVILTCQTIHVHDILSPESRAKYPETPGLKYGTGHRTVLAVPLVREGTAMGVILIRRREVRPFSDTQIKLLEMFADQAVIAIENVRLFREIEEKSAQLEIANKHKSDFLANMSHELRTPLNAIIGFSEVLIDRMFGEVNEKQADYLKDIHESGRHLLSLINDILDLAKIEAGRMELEVSRFHLPTAISNAMTLIRERAQRHGIQLGAELDARLGEFEADERKVKQILLNLLSNAVKFTPDGGRIDVSAKLDTTNVEIAVRDTGIGIAPEDQGALFEEFKQVGTDYTRKAEGTGLGLALTKKFVELHGGGIRVDSTPGKGSTFSFTLPVRQE